MKRRIYETAEDRQREDWVMGKLARANGWRYKRAAKLSSYDGEMCSFTNFGIRPMALVEVKCRTSKKYDHPTLICARKKIDSGVKLAEGREVEYILAVRWMDVISYLRITSESAKTFEVTRAGRKDRNDKADMEPCYMIPMAGFTDLPIEARL